jgi:hypothetical protein
MTNLPELSFNSPAAPVATDPATPVTQQQPELPEINDDIWKVVSNTDAPPKTMSGFEAARRGIDQGVQDFNLSFTVNRLVGEGLDKLGFPTWKKKVEAYKKGINDRYAEAAEAKPAAAIGGRIVGGIGATAPTFAISAPAQIAGKVVPALAGRMLQGGAQSAAMGAAATEGNPLDNIRNYGATGALLSAIPGGAYAATAAGAAGGAGYSYLTGGDPMQGALVGGSLGLGGYGVGRAIKGAPSTISTLSGKTSTNAADALTLSHELKKEGIDFPLSLADTKKQGIYKSLEYFLMDKLPFIGTASIRSRQLDAYAPTVQSLITKVAGSKEGTAANVGNIIKTEAVKAKSMATKAFDEVSLLTEKFNQVGNNVNISGLKIRAKELLQEADDGIIGGNYASTLRKIIDKPDQISFKAARTLRSTLGNQVEAMNASSTKTNGTIVGGYKQLFNGLNKDLDSWGNTQHPQVTEAYNKAKTMYKGYKQIFGSKDMHKALSDDAAMLDFVKKASLETNPIRAAQFTKALGGEAGQAENRAFALNEAFNVAYNPHTRILDPIMFVHRLDKTAATNGVRFGKTIDAIKGYTNLLTLGERGFKSAQNPVTGYVLSSAVTGGAVAGAYNDPANTAKVGVPVAVLGVIARNPQLFIHAGKATLKTDPSVINALQNTINRRLLNAGITLDVMQDDPQEQ